MTNKPEVSTEHRLEDVLEKVDEISALNRKLDSIASRMEGSRIEDILQNYGSPWRIIRINFLVGLARGIGLTVGTAVFLAIALYILSKIVTLPLVGEYIAELLEWIESYRVNNYPNF
ncbi:hypothetical protein BHF68_05335 [Desulfuribacillus alkaliarsenatis]|uniref:Signal transduction histidine kinase n=1 Tax=Desulfuribacillus alkaliarsenatis TaxID=766136 RepID=A0A1E5G2S0_9FIRM|nr:hypothetical protein BHF68_05335 [Desulfuribacillus alkaliarsenatis]